MNAIYTARQDYSAILGKFFDYSSLCASFFPSIWPKEETH